jgi:hypothetical protein
MIKMKYNLLIILKISIIIISLNKGLLQSKIYLLPIILYQPPPPPPIFKNNFLPLKAALSIKGTEVLLLFKNIKILNLKQKPVFKILKIFSTLRIQAKQKIIQIIRKFKYFYKNKLLNLNSIPMPKKFLVENHPKLKSSVFSN